MKITVLLFGQQARIAGTRRLEVEAEPATVTGVRRALASACPDLVPSLPAARVAVNHAIAAESDPVAAGDEVALIGLVGGG